jgi:CRISPR-associated protein Cmr6
LFKASLQGHVRRLLAGVSNRKDDVDQVVNRLFGCTTEPGSLQLYWQSQSIDVSQTIGQENTPIYQAKGTLYLDVKNKKDRHFMENVLKFAFTMGGFGKSWRRVWHQDFFPNYKTRAIGCHWEWLDSDLKKLEIQSSDEFKKFLNHLHKETQQYLGISKPQSLSWKEAWNPERLTVYSQVVDRSQAIRLFHNEQFKTTPAIGGRQPGDQRPTFFSCVWHRMLPIEQNKYLEIVTLFHGGQSKNLTDQWIRKANGNNENQLPVFVKQLENQGFQKTWGSYPPKS